MVYLELAVSDCPQVQVLNIRINVWIKKSSNFEFSIVSFNPSELIETASVFVGHRIVLALIALWEKLRSREAIFFLEKRVDGFVVTRHFFLFVFRSFGTINDQVIFVVTRNLSNN